MALRSLFRRAVQASVLIAGALGLVQCVDGPTSPGGSRSTFAFAPVWDSRASQTAALLDDAGFPLDRVRIILIRPPSEVLKDTTLVIHADDPPMDLGLTVPARPGEEVVLRLQFLSGTTLLFEGTTSVTTVAPTAPNVPVVPVTPEFVGPGATAKTVDVGPASGSFSTSAPVAFTATVRDQNGIVLTGAVLAWTVNDATLGAISNTGVFTPSGKRGNVTVTASTPTSISGSATVGLLPPPASIAIVSGNNQSGPQNTVLGSPVVVVVKATDGIPSPGETVTFAALDGGTVTNASVVTDANGLAQTTLRVGTRIGSYSFTATAGSLSVPISATGTASGPAAIAVVSGNAQSDTVLKPLANPFVVKVTDAAGAAVSGATVTWTRQAGAGSVAAATSLTNASGQATMAYTLGLTPGTETVQATVAGVSMPATFTATAIQRAPATLVVLSGDAQTDTVMKQLASPFAVKVAFSNGDPASGVTVTWTRLTGAGSPSTSTSVTNASGIATLSYTLGSAPGSESVRASVTGIATTRTFTATALTGAPAAIAIISGDAQTDTVRKTLANPFVVKVTDVGGNPVSGAVVRWTRVLGAGAVGAATSTTDASGVAQASYTLGNAPGAESVTAEVTGVATPATFNATAVADLVPAAITISSGNAQTDTVGKTLVASLVVRVANAHGDPIAGATVSWARLTGAGALSAVSSTTDAAGLASIRYALGTVAGAESIRASVAGLATTVTFAATAVAASPAALTIVSGDAQVDTIHKTLANPFVVRVADAFGNPVAGKVVSWSRTGGFGSPVTSSSTTNALGLASLVYTLGDIGGADTVRASVAGVTGTVSFVVGVRDGLGTPVVTGFAYLQVLPSPVTVRVGDTVTFTADSVSATGQASRVTASWASDNPGRGAIDATGRMIVADTGRIIVTATRNGMIGHARVTVLPAPMLTGFTFSPKTLNGIANSPLTFSLSMSVVDKGASGITSAVVTITGPTGITRTCTATTPTSGTSRNGTFDCSITLPAGSATGAWHVTSLVLTGSTSRTFLESVLATFGTTTLTVNP